MAAKLAQHLEDHHYKRLKTDVDIEVTENGWYRCWVGKKVGQGRSPLQALEALDEAMKQRIR